MAPDGGIMRPAVKALAQHGSEVFATWRQPDNVWVTGLPSEVEPLKLLGEAVGFEELLAAARETAVAGS